MHERLRIIATLLFVLMGSGFVVGKDMSGDKWVKHKVRVSSVKYYFLLKKKECVQ